jgi:S1-C subfamily serine protease
MSRFIAVCLFSGVVGALAATAYWDSIPRPDAGAQEPRPGTTAPRPAPGTPELRPLAVPPLGTPPPAGTIPGGTTVPPRSADLRADDAGRRPGPPLGFHSPASIDDEYTPEERVAISVYEHANRSVVNINTRSVRPDAFFLFEVPSEGAGSGSVLDKQGHILTNHHVIEGAREIRVTLYNGETYEAGLVGQDPVNDMAVLRIAAPAEALFPVALGDSSRLRVGQSVYALGNPFGLERTLTRGIISSLNRSLPSRTGRTMKSIIQIDAALNRGNSGGPLLDSHARLIGMNTAIASRSGENTGVGFAIPVGTIARVVPQLIADGKVVRPDIGITRVYETDKGIVIATLSQGGPAERAGLVGFRMVREQRRRGPFVYEETRIDRSNADVIVAIDGQKVHTADELLDAIERKRPGQQVAVTVLRAGRETVVNVTLGAGE